MGEQGEHQDEYHDAVVDMLELIWGKGYMTPGGPENVKRAVQGLNLRDKLVLDIGSGIGGPALMLAGELGARVIGLDLEAPLIRRAEAYAREAGLTDRVEFRQVTPGSTIQVDDAAIDVVFSCGAFTQIENKRGMFQEVYRVLKPGGVFACYDWMKNEGPYSDDMHYWFELEGLTYAMDTLENHGQLLKDVGFVDVELEDTWRWYRDCARDEYERMKGPLKAQMIELLGRDQQEHFVENWRAMVIVLDKGEMRPGRYRGFKPAQTLS